MKLICAADLHLGRVPSRIPSDLPVDPSALTPAAAWRRLVETTIEERADALLLAGDVVEDRRDFYEAYADLEAGAALLREAGIPVFAVSGNHDVDVLPRLADEVEGVRLLGRGGTWECVPFESGGRRIRILGWSFPSARVVRSPLERSPESVVRDAGGGTVVGLLHGDLDGTGPYAPVRGRDLADAPVDAWLLGHVHVPGDLRGSRRPIGYLGSLAASDPGEEGVRGAWRALVGEDGTLAMERVPLAPLRYEELRVPLDELDSADEVSNSVLSALGSLLDRVDGDEGLLALACRLVFTGRTPRLQEIRRVLEREDPGRLRTRRGDLHAFVHGWRVEAQPDLDLVRLAEGTDPVAIAARTLLAVRGGDSPERTALLDALRPRVAAVERKSAFRGAPLPALDDEALAKHLERVALRALAELLAQREGATA